MISYILLLHVQKILRWSIPEMLFSFITYNHFIGWWVLLCRYLTWRLVIGSDGILLLQISILSFKLEVQKHVQWFFVSNWRALWRSNSGKFFTQPFFVVNKIYGLMNLFLFYEFLSKTYQSFNTSFYSLFFVFHITLCIGYQEHWVKKLTSYFKYCVQCSTQLALSVNHIFSYCSLCPHLLAACVSRSKKFGIHT
jgi:hypothetical protein